MSRTVLAIACYITYTGVMEIREDGIKNRNQIGGMAVIFVAGLIIGGIYSYNALANIIEIISGNFNYEARHIRDYLHFE